MSPSQALNVDYLAKVRFIATDMDGTLTQTGKFTADLLQSLEALAQAGIPVLIVTGRSAGWVHGLVAYLPVVGAIAENGGLFYAQDSENPQLLVEIPSYSDHRRQLAAIFQRLHTEFPQIQETADNQFRITDWTFDNRNLSVTELQTIAARCQSWGWGFTYSNVQCHIKPQQQDKARGLQQVLQQAFPAIALEQVMTVGDSPNDVSLFDPAIFSCSVGVANVRHYWEELQYRPQYVTTQAEGAGFSELAHWVLKAQPISV